MLAAKASLESIRLIFEDFPKRHANIQGTPKPCAEHKNNLQADVYLGKPILEFRIDRLSDKNFHSKAKEILEKWIKIDLENLDHRTLGYTFYHMPGEYLTNELPSEETHAVGNFLDALENKDNTSRYY